jgi:hypothetical protein
MRPIRHRDSGQQDLLRSGLDQIVDPAHALVKMARAIDWRFLEDKLDAVNSEGHGQPPLPTRADGGPRGCDGVDAPRRHRCAKVEVSITPLEGGLPALSALSSLLRDSRMISNLQCIRRPIATAHNKIIRNIVANSVVLHG